MNQVEKIKNRLKVELDNKYELIGEYGKWDTETEFKCTRCGNIFTSTPKKMLSKSKIERCEVCNVKVQEEIEKKRIEERIVKFIKDLKEVHGDKYEYVSGFITREDKCTFRCNCGNTFITRPKDVLKKSRIGCTSCYGDKRDFSHTISEEEFKERFNAKYPNGEFELVSEYTGYKDSNVKFKHKVCGQIFSSSPYNILAKKNPDECAKCPTNSKTHEQFVIDIVHEGRGEYVPLERYNKNNKSKILFKHLECGYEFKMAPNNFLNGHRCPRCTSSMNEILIFDFFIHNNIKFESEKTFEGLKHKASLRFDFYIPEYNLLLEYDGEQHFGEVEIFRDSLEEIKVRDEIKNKWIKDSQYSLIRLRYDQDVEYLLNEIFINKNIPEDLFYIK